MGFVYVPIQGCPVPVDCLAEHSKVLHLHAPTWDTMYGTIDMCCGCGGMNHGTHAPGFQTKVAVDRNEKMCELFQKRCSDVPGVQGGLGDPQNLLSTWHHATGVAVRLVGCAFQPYPRLEASLDGRDAQAACLTHALAVASLLRFQALVMACASPALHSEFVCAEILKSLSFTGFSMRHPAVTLHDVWPSRRHRDWWIWSYDLIGPISVTLWLSSRSLLMLDRCCLFFLVGTYGMNWHLDSVKMRHLDLACMMERPPLTCSLPME